MLINEFFNFFLDELRDNEKLRRYYRFLESPKRFEFRKTYFCQRLEYIQSVITDKNARILDCGCGYGTTGIYLSLNGYKVEGLTLEYYHDEISSHKQFWAKYGYVDGFNAIYQNIFDTDYPAETFDYIILQDTLHHLEPLDKALDIFSKIIKPNGKIILVEENGRNIIQNIKLIRQRGFKKVKEVYDSKQDKTFLLGDENIRSLNKWRTSCEKHDLKINEESVQYIRFYPPSSFMSDNSAEIISKEQKLWQKNRFLKNFFFFGLNFVLEKQRSKSTT